MTSKIDWNTSAGKETVVRLSEVHPHGFSIKPGLHTLESIYFQFIKINLENIYSLQHASRLSIARICMHSSHRDSRERKKYAAVHVRAYERVFGCFGGHLVLRACTVFTRCLQDLSQHVYFSCPHLPTATGTVCALNSMVVRNGTTTGRQAISSIWIYLFADVWTRRATDIQGWQLFNKPPTPASVSTSRMLWLLRSKRAPGAGKGDSVVATH